MSRSSAENNSKTSDLKAAMKIRQELCNNAYSRTEKVR